MVEFVVEADDEGFRLDAFLASKVGSRASAQKAIAEERVTVDGESRPKSWKVSPGERVAVLPEAQIPVSRKPLDGEVPIAWQGTGLVVVDKPAGIVSHPAPGNREGTLSQMLDSMFPLADIGLVHRLDRDTSGLLMAALDADSLRLMRERLQRREITREYVALVIGHPRTAEGTIDAPIGRDRRSRTRMSIRTDKPREAITHFEVLETLSASSLLRVRLETGRTHQIRAHLAEIGLRVAGDPVYGKQGAWGLSRQFLHAARLSFEAPGTDGVVEVESALPTDLAGALERARSGANP